MLKFLAVIGWILLALLVLIVWVIIVPRSVFVEYTNAAGPVVKVRIFLFKIKVYPLPFAGKKDKKQKADKNQKTDKTTKDKNQKEEKQDILGGFMKDMPKGFELVKEVLCAVKGVMAILLKGISIKDVSFTVPVKAGDAYQTQKQYGTVTSAFYTFSIFLQKYVRINFKKPVFVADFADLYKDSTYFYCKIQASPSIILVVGWYLFKTYRRLTKHNNTPIKEK